jgi:predicted amidohydrolase YtcJ
MRILLNAQFPQSQSSHPERSALAIDQGRVLAIGSKEEILVLSKVGDSVEDMHGNFLLPAVCDSHIHLLEYAHSLSKVDCETPTLQECLQRVRQRTETTPAGKWVLGHGWDHNQWEEGFGDACLLDAISQNHPIYLTAKSLHAGWANSAAMDAASIQDETPDPKGGKILRDGNSHPNGILLESAMQLVEKVIPQPDRAEIHERLLLAQHQLNRFGITSVHDFDTWEIFSILQELDNEGKLTLRVVKGMPRGFLNQAIESGLRSGQRCGNLQIGWLKLFSDGALGAQSAAMLEPYEDNPGNRGMLMMESDEISEIGRTAVKNGIDLAVHAIGDRANRVVLDAFRTLRKIESRLHLPHRHHRIEHVQIIQPGDQNRLAELGIIASMQPIHVLSDQETADRHWGARCTNAYAWKSLLKNGASLIFGSDAPVESPNPFLGLVAATTRRKLQADSSLPGWHTLECLNMKQAWQAYTSTPAFAAGWSERLGKLEKGFEADLMVLEKNPFSLPAAEVAKLLPIKTMQRGKWIWGQDS